MTSGYLRGSNNLLAGAAGQGGYTIEESLRFNSSQSSYLSRAQGSATSTTTGTWSGWCKRGKLGAQQFIWSSSNYDFLQFNSNDTIRIAYLNNLGYVSTAAVYRDPSAWYHIVLVFDTTNATAVDRMRLYVNGVQQTLAWGGTSQTQNATFQRWNVSGYTGDIGDFQYNHINFFDGYMAECYWVDGQALTPSDFGEYNAITGVWQPIEYEGTYGNNGFYLPMKLDNTTEGFNTVTWVGNDSTQKISGVGFSPDLVWLKTRNIARDNYLYDSVRGTAVSLTSNNTAADLASGGEFDSFDTDGFTVKFVSGLGRTNYAGREYVGWCWDAGDTTVSNTDGSITSSVRASTDYGFSVVTWTGNGANATVGHSLGIAPSMVIVKNRSANSDWLVQNAYLTSPAYALVLSGTNAQNTNANWWNSTAPTSTTFSVGNGSIAVNGSGQGMVAYCFSEIAGYSKFGSYTANTTTPPVVTGLGFRPAFLMVKNISRAEDWAIVDNTRDVGAPITKYLAPNNSAVEVSSVDRVTFNDDGFTVNAPAGYTFNFQTGDTYIYMAFKDTREYAFWLDDSGNNNDWQPNGGITTGSTVTDTPTPYADGGNYAVLNPLIQSANTFSDGNLKVTMSANAPAKFVSSIGAVAGKWYCEFDYYGTGNRPVGISADTTPRNYLGMSDNNTSVSFWPSSGNTQLYVNGASTSWSGSTTTWISGDVIGIALDADNELVYLYKNGTSLGSVNYGTLNWNQAFFAGGNYVNGVTYQANFGQRPFAYTPPTGFKSLHTGNLPDAAIGNGSEYFNPVLYQGNNGASLAVTGAGFQPDLVWIKNRSTSNNHNLVDSVRGVNLTLFSNTTDDEDTSTERVTSIDADGFTVGTNNGVNANDTYVSWLWKAGGAAVTNTAGSITSQVSASPTAGFSVVTFTGNASGSATVGHGLGTAPSMVIVKRRDVADGWPLYHSSLGVSKLLELHSTSGEQTSSNYWGSAITSTTFGLSAGGSNNRSGSSNVAYCFSEVPGYSSFGSYVGNASADGPFVFTNFRPRWVLVKCSSAGGNWILHDTSRSPSNVSSVHLRPNSSAAEDTGTGEYIDILSNGFKLRGTGGNINLNGGTFIYMAFAENPFKNSLAR